MAALAIKRSRFRITRKVQPIFSQSNVIELTYAQKKTTANLARQQLLKQHTNKLRLLFRNVHTVSKNNLRSRLQTIKCLCHLDEVKGWEVNFWASETWSGRVHFEGHSPEWRVLSKLSVQPYSRLLLRVEDTVHFTKDCRSTNLLSCSSFFCPFVFYCCKSALSPTPNAGSEILSHR